MGLDEHKVLEFRVGALEAVVGEIKSAVKSIDQSLQSLARLETRHAETRDGLARAFDDIEDHETRLRTVEGEMPTMKLTRSWTMRGVIYVVGVVGLALIGLVIFR